MKNFLKILLVVVASLVAGAYLHKCQSPPGDNIPGREAIETDTITVYDTIPYIGPAPVHSQQVGSKKVTIPTSYIDRGILSPQCSESARRLENLPDIRADTTELTSADIEATAPDSLTLQLPITQNVYEGEDYTAYVSGYHARLDSIFVYTKCDVITKTIKEPPNRKHWHIGITGGYALTPKGMQPYIGVGITYSILSF